MSSSPSPPEFAYAAPPLAFESGEAIPMYTMVLQLAYQKTPKRGSKEHEYLVAQVDADGEEGYLCFERVGGPIMQLVDSQMRIIRQSHRNIKPFGSLCSLVNQATKIQHARDGVKYLKTDRLEDSDQRLAHLDFTEKPPTVSEVALLAWVVHDTHDYYMFAGQNCFWFSGFLFKLLTKLPGAKLETDTDNERLGSWKAFVQTYEAADEELDEAMSRFSSQWQCEKEVLEVEDVEAQEISEVDDELRADNDNLGI